MRDGLSDKAPRRNTVSNCSLSSGPSGVSSSLDDHSRLIERKGEGGAIETRIYRLRNRPAVMCSSTEFLITISATAATSSICSASQRTTWRRSHRLRYRFIPTTVRVRYEVAA